MISITNEIIYIDVLRYARIIFGYKSKLSVGSFCELKTLETFSVVQQSTQKSIHYFINLLILKIDAICQFAIVIFLRFKMQPFNSGTI